MKNLDLNFMGVQELNAVEMKETDGGFWATIGITIGIIAGLVYLYDFGYNYAKARL